MTIPSSGLIQEIMLYENILHGGFCASPKLNSLGMPCIGYGFPLWEEALSILHGNTSLAKSIKCALPKEQENISLGINRLLSVSYTVTEQTAQKLLEQSLLYYAEELGRMFSGFRHLVNQCAESTIFSDGDLARYEALLRVQNSKFSEEKQQIEKEKNVSHKKQSVKSSYLKHAGKTKRNSIGFNKRESSAEYSKVFAEPDSFVKKDRHDVLIPAHSGATSSLSTENGLKRYGLDVYSSTLNSVHPAFLTTPYSGFDTVFIAKNKKKSIGRKKGVGPFSLSETEKALFRVDSVLFLTHLLGLDMTSRMQAFFSALQRDDYAFAASELLAHSASSYLGAVMHMLARRIRDASLDFQDMFIATAQPVRFLLHRKKAKSYMLRYYHPKKPDNRQLQLLEQAQFSDQKLCSVQATEMGAYDV